MSYRRDLLRSTAAVAAGAVAGCSQLRQRSPLRRMVAGTVPTQQVDAARRGHVPDVAGPVENPTVAWTASLGESIESSPVVADSTVYVGANDPDGEGHAHALDALSGVHRWKTGFDDDPALVLQNGSLYAWTSYERYRLDPGSGSIAEEWEAEGSDRPVVHGDLSFTVSADRLHAAELDGRARWESEYFDANTPPATDGTRVYVGTLGDDVLAWTLDGDLAWTGPVGRDVTATPTIAGGTVVVGAVDFAVHALDAGTGRERWSHGTGGPVYASPAVADGTVYAASTDGALYALALGDGTERWRLDTGDSLDTGFRVGPVVAGGVVYAVDVGGRVHAVDGATGEQLWTVDAGRPPTAPPAVVEALLFVPVQGGRVVAVAGGDGR